MCILCRVNIFTQLLPSNDKGDLHTDTNRKPTFIFFFSNIVNQSKEITFVVLHFSLRPLIDSLFQVSVSWHFIGPEFIQKLWDAGKSADMTHERNTGLSFLPWWYCCFKYEYRLNNTNIFTSNTVLGHENSVSCWFYRRLEQFWVKSNRYNEGCISKNTNSR